MIDGLAHDTEWRFKLLNEYLDLKSMSKDLYKYCSVLGTVLQDGGNTVF